MSRRREGEEKHVRGEGMGWERECTRRTFRGHADGDALEVAAALALVARALVHVALLDGFARVLQALLDRAPEEALAACTCVYVCVCAFVFVCFSKVSIRFDSIRSALIAVNRLCLHQFTRPTLRIRVNVQVNL